MKPVFLLLVVVVSVAAGAEDRAVASLTKTAQVGGVYVSVTPLNLTERGSATIDFTVALETHSGSLPDVLNSASLIRQGGGETQPLTWSGGKGGHHLSGKLSFPGAGRGKDGVITMVLKRLDGRGDARLEWKLPVKSVNNSAVGT
jgi:hypothetical protein